MNYANNAINQQANSNFAGFTVQAGQIGNTPAEQPYLTQEFERTHAAVSDLESQLEWLIQKIQPICQASPPASGVGGSCGSGQPEAQPSEVRQTLINLRNRIDGMSYRIAAVKYTIEV
jgi:hypothetical protein